MPETDLLHLNHGYDRASNRLHADREVYESHSQTYTYDNLNRLTDYSAGKIKDDLSGISPYWKLDQQTWHLDPLGNHLAVDTPESSDKSTNTPNAANEYTSRATKGDKTKDGIEDSFDDPGSASNWESIGSETIGIGTGEVTVSNLVADTIGSNTESEPRAVYLMGANLGPASRIVLVRFADGTTQGQAGYVFGYKSSDDYWIEVFDVATDDRRIYHVVNGNRGTAIHTVAATVKVGSSLSNNLYTSAKHQALSGLMFPDGFPSGRTGLYTNTANASFLTLVSDLPSDPAFLTDRWICYPSDWGSHFTEIDPSTDRLRVDGSDEIDLLPMLLHGVRVDRFEAVFSAKWWYAGGNHSHSAFSFIFNATNQDDYDYLLIRLRSVNAKAPSGWEVISGQWRVALSGTSYDANMFATTSSTTAWFRVTSDGTEVKIYVQDSATEPTTWNESTDLVHETTSFDITGGMIGFMGANTDIAIDNLTLKSDRNADGTYETVEHIESFTLDTTGAAQETPTHDDAGNLTYDGVYQYKYDAWNRLVTITKAYRDDQGTLQTGSTVATMIYDGLGRRITKAIQNSADLDATYHYYYDNQSIVEMRNGSNQVIKQQIWGNLAGQYVDDLVQIAVNGDPNEDPDFDPTDVDHDPHYYYALQDANFNVLGLVDCPYPLVVTSR